MPKKVTFEHKKELKKALIENDKTDDEVIKYFKDKYKIKITKELIDKTRDGSFTRK